MQQNALANEWFHPPISVARESACAPSPTAVMGEGKEFRKGMSDMARRLKSGTNIKVSRFHVLQNSFPHLTLKTCFKPLNPCVLFLVHFLFFSLERGH